MVEFREKLLEASYRGVPFVTTSSSLRTGRRAARHTFPLRDTPFIEDLGRMVEEVQLTAFLKPSDDYDKDRDRLIKACREPGVGFPHVAGAILVHPYLGQRRMLCTSCVVTEAANEGRTARLELTFVEAPDTRPPRQRRDHKGTANARATAAEEASASNLVAKLEPKGPEAVRLATSAKLAEFGQMLQGLDIFTGTAREAAALQRSSIQLVANASALATAPADLAAEVLRLSREVLAVLPESARGAFFAYQSLLETRPTTSGGNSARGLAADLNSTLVANLIRTAAAGGAVRAGAAAKFAFRREALEARASISTELDLLAESSGDDDRTYSALLDLRAILVEAVPPLIEQLPSLRTIRPAGSTTTLEIAYQVYDDLEREGEIQDRNRITHPAFVPAGVPLELLVDA